MLGRLSLSVAATVLCAQAPAAATNLLRDTVVCGFSEPAVTIRVDPRRRLVETCDNVAARKTRQNFSPRFLRDGGMLVTSRVATIRLALTCKALDEGERAYPFEAEIRLSTGQFGAGTCTSAAARRHCGLSAAPLEAFVTGSLPCGN